MNYFMGVVDTVSNSGTGSEIADIDAFNESLRNSNHWVLAAGLAHPDASTMINATCAHPTVLDEPLVRHPEFISGFWIISVENHETAVALATAASRACNRKVELRPFL